MNRIALARFNPQSKIVTHPQFAAYLAGERVYPISIEISPSGACQASCTGCWYLDQHKAVFLDTSRLYALIQECKVLGIKSITWTGGGDPSLHPDIANIVSYASGVGIEQGMFTNALANPKYNPALLKWIRVTITNKPPNVEYIKALLTCPTVGIAFNYSGPQDDDELASTVALGHCCQVDYVQVRPKLPPNGETISLDPPQFADPLLHVTDYKFDEARRHHQYETCEAYHFTPFIFEDGSVNVCAYQHKKPEYVLGNIYKQSLKEILDAAPRSVPVREDCQTCCKLHEANVAIHAARKLEDRNFP